MQFIYEDYYRGKPRKLLILPQNGGSDYRVFWESSLLGVITSQRDENQILIWKSVYDILKPIAGKIGAHIESCK